MNRNDLKIQIHNVDEYKYPYLYTHNLSCLYAYPIINCGNEWYREASCIPYDGTPFYLDNEVVKKDPNDELGILLHYLTGDLFCSIYGYTRMSFYSPINCDKIVFFKGFALDCIIHLYPEAIGAFTIIVPEIGENKKKHSFTYIITNSSSSMLYQQLEISIYTNHSIPKSVTDINRSNIILCILSAIYECEITDLISTFNWNNLLNYHAKSKLEQSILNYIYPQNFKSPYSEEEICFPEFVNNFICIANVNAYNYQVDGDTINKNYNRFINIMNAFPSFLKKIPLAYYSHLSRALYFTAEHFDDIRINDRLFILSYNTLNKAFDITKMIYLSFLRCNLIEIRYNSAVSITSKLYPDLSSKRVEDKVRTIQLADFLLVEKCIPNYISPKEEIAIRCNQTIDDLYYNYGTDNNMLFTLVRCMQQEFNDRLSNFVEFLDS